MNCKPGDLARVIDGAASRKHGTTDKIIRCVRASSNPRTGAPGWLIEPNLTSKFDGDVIYGIDDSALRPIRDPGDDVVSQETRKLPVDAGIVQLRETVRAFQAMREAGVCP